tara:strand:- start:3565 stop:7008 length:3444 start_codon:yes stop_codon:yes gene_type:complete
MQPLLSPQFPRNHHHASHWGGMIGCANSLVCARLIESRQQPVLIVTPDIASTEQLKENLQLFLPPNAYASTMHFPDQEILPYDLFSPHADLISSRLSVLAQLQQPGDQVVIAALPTLLRILPPRDYLRQNAFLIKTGGKLSIDHCRQSLTAAGYHHVSQVMEHGEFLIRGSIIDVFPMGTNLPLRIELFDDVIDSLRLFDPETQRTIKKIPSLTLLPANEYPLTDESIERFRLSWRRAFTGNPLDSPVYESISDGKPINGIEAYQPLFFDQTATLFDYLSDKTMIIHIGNTQEAFTTHWHDVQERYEQLRYDITRPCLPVEQLYLTKDNWHQRLKGYQQIFLSNTASASTHVTFACKSLPPLSVAIKAKEPMKKLHAFISEYQGKVIIAAESAGRHAVILQQLQQSGLSVNESKSWQDFLQSDQPLHLIVAPIQQGFIDTDANYALITEADCYADYVSLRRKRKKANYDPGQLIKSLAELNVDDYVVHIDHGIGRYNGLVTITNNDIEAEYLSLRYANDDKIFVPITDLHAISRYAKGDQDHITLHRLGNAQWEKQKKKAAEKVHDIAAELLALYAKREATPGYAYTINDTDYQAFRQSFPYEETEDQQRAIDAVVNDMKQPRSMDRLVCGDVGFGKTEIAMQAAFIAANDGKQVAILVPTTLLAQQHYQTFCDRLSLWPLTVGIVSRMQTPKQQKATLAALASGQLDIIVGTHKLLQKSIQFQHLGLMIVDEEHRFGVKQKETIKAMRAEVDLLTLTATPIPRTLNMALSGSRDLSIIATPPAKRLAVKTFLHRMQPAIVIEAIQRELLRGGQVYFLHNEVATIDAMKEQLMSWIPNISIAVAHGQLSESQLERTMADFYHQKHNVLLCTTIIESGIDIPTANTILVNKANRFGLAQLHQIRGRVGRSHHQAYAYLLVDEIEAISKDAEKRLHALVQLDELGAGFQLATHDLEIRGAGELLGDEQSGHMQAIGYTLYMDMLSDAIDALKNNEQPSLIPSSSNEPEVNCGIPALFPETYVRDVSTRLQLYKRLTQCESNDDLDDFQVECIDRFGALPPVAKNLISIQSLKLRAKNLGIKQIDAKAKYGYFIFSESPNVDPARIIQLIQQQPKQYQLHQPNGLRFLLPETQEERVQHILAAISEIRRQ